MTRSASPADGIALLTAFALFMAALGVTTFHLGSRSLIFDEATSVMYARSPPSELAATITEDPNQSLFYVFLSGWVRASGESEAAIRLPSAVAISIATPLVFLVGRRLFDSTVGLWGGLFFLGNAFIVRFAQTARAYGFLTLLTLLATLLLIDELARPSARRRAAYVVVAVLAIHAHFFAALTLAAHASILLLARAPWRTWVPVGLAIALLCAPVAWLAVMADGEQLIGWIEPLSLAVVWEALTDFVGGSTQLLAALLALTLLGSVWTLGPGRRRVASGWRAETGLSPHAVLIVLLLVPLAVALAVSSIQPVFIPYYLIACVPALCLLAASAWPALGRFAAPAVMAAVLLLSLGRLPYYDAVDRAEDWRDAARHILSERRPDDVVIFVPDGARKPFDYYARQAGEQVAARHADDPGGASRVWLLVRDSDMGTNRARLAGVHATLGTTHRQIDQPRFQRLTVERWER